MANISLPTCRLEVVSLSPEEYSNLASTFYRRPEFTDDYNFDSYIGEKRETEYRLQMALGRIWTIEEDFEVADDENIAFTLCGGIYSARIVSREYLEILHRVLQQTPMRDRWVYNTAIEIAKPSVETVDFVLSCSVDVHRNTLYIDEREIRIDNFIRLFSRSREIAESEGIAGLMASM